MRLAGLRELLLPIAVVGAGMIYYFAEQPFWVAASVALPLIALYLIAPVWAAHSIADFDRDFVRLLAGGERGRLPARYLRALGMRLFAERSLRAERRALVAAETGDASEARASYRLALRESGRRAPLRVLLGYAHACYALSDDAEAIRIYRELLDQAGSLPGVRRNLAHALVRRGDSLREALELLDLDSGTADSDRRAERDLMRAVAHAKLGEREKARDLAERAQELESELGFALRAELERALDGGSTPRPA